MYLEENLPSILDHCWHLLFRGAVQKKHLFHTPVVGTIEEGVAQLRTVVLRKTDRANRQLIFYTDIRSPKVEQLKNQPVLSWLFYHPGQQIQLRAFGKTTIHSQNVLTLENWQKIPVYGRKTYGTLNAPGHPLAFPNDDLPAIWTTEDIELAQTEYAYNNFAVIVCKINKFEWLSLKRTGHQRAQFIFQKNEWIGQWVVP